MVGRSGSATQKSWPSNCGDFAEDLRQDLGQVAKLVFPRKCRDLAQDLREDLGKDLGQVATLVSLGNVMAWPRAGASGIKL